MVKIVITGGCGFIGHHFAEYVHKNTDWDIIIFDKLTYASMGLNRLRNNELLYSKRVKIYTIDICNEISDGIQKEIGNDIDYIVHMAAETHVDNSIKEPEKIIKNNVNSTVSILEWARTLSNLKIFFYRI
jgi:dTDP-glucose 4,6-dehydratase